MLDVVVGGLYGSEAKGAVTQMMVQRRINQSFDVVTNIRVGGPNAGHTGYDANGIPWAFRQVPVGAVVPVPEGRRIDLEIAAGSEIDLPVLLAEIDYLEDAGLLYNKRLVVHGEATLITDQHKDAETGGMAHGMGGLTASIGSTGKGIGAARADRLMRKAKRVIDSEMAMETLQVRGVEVVMGDSGDWRVGSSVVVEGTQGYALGLHAGFYPQCTTSDCRAIDFLSMAGISPWDLRYVPNPEDLNILVVARVFPIRVAGNSGPMQNETSWESLGLAPEQTTVTKKVRRVGLPDWELVARAVRANGGQGRVRVALTMVDQAHPKTKNRPWSATDPGWQEAQAGIELIEEQIGAPISIVRSGPDCGAFRNWED